MSNLSNELNAVRSNINYFPEENLSGLGLVSPESSGPFIVPSDVLGRPDITGYILGAATSQGKVQWVPSNLNTDLKLGDLQDVNTAGVIDGDVIMYDAATQTWVPAAIISGLSAGLGIDPVQFAANIIQLDITTRFTFSGNQLDLDTVTPAYGGTGQTTLTSGRVLIGQGPLPLDTSKAPPSGAFVGTTDAQTLFFKTLTSSTNDITARSLFSNNGVNTVSVFASGNPSAGSVLTATSSTTATWQMFSGALTAGLGIDAAQLALNTIQIENTARFIFSGNALELATVTVPFGGTGQTTLTSNGVLLGQGAGAVDTSKQAPSGAFVGTTDAQAFTNKTITDSSNDVTARDIFVTAGNVVSIDTSPVPSADQVLTATGATTAIFQSLSTTLSAGLGIDATQLASNTIQLDTTARFMFSANALELVTVTVPFGGTGQTTLTSNGVLLGQGISPVNTSKQAPVGDFVGTTDAQTLTNKTLTSNTNDITARSLFSNNGANTVSVFASANPSAGQVLTATNSTTATWQSITSGLTAGLGIDATQLASSTIQIENTARFTFSGNALELATVTAPFGGTGQTTLTSNGVLVGQGAAAVDTSKAAPVGDFVGTTDTQTLTNKTMTDSTNDVTARAVFSNSGANTVSVFAAANPSVGQVLTATGSTTATWQDVSGGLSAGLGIDATQLASNTIQVENTARFTFSGNSLELATVAVPFGGTGQTTLTSNGVLVGQGVAAVDTSKAAPIGDFVGTTDTQTLTNKTMTSSTNNVTARALFSNSGANTVSVFAAANPTADQVLTATSSTTATWQDVPLSNFSRTITVSQNAPDVSPDWTTIGAAITDASSMTPTATNQILILVYPGDYSETVSLTVPSYVTISGQTDEVLGTVTVRPTAPTASSPVFLLQGNAAIEGMTIDGFDGSAAYANRGVEISGGSSGDTDYVTNVHVQNVSNFGLFVNDSGRIGIINGYSFLSELTNTTAGIACALGATIRGSEIRIEEGSSNLARGVFNNRDNSEIYLSDVTIINCNIGIRSGANVTSTSNRDYPFTRISNLTFQGITQVCLIYDDKGVVELFNATFSSEPGANHIESQNPASPADQNKLTISSSTLRQDLIENTANSDNPLIIQGNYISEVPGEDKNVVDNFLETGGASFGTGTGTTENMVVFRNATDITDEVLLPVVNPFLCELASTGSINLASAPATIDGVAPTSGVTRVLVKDGSSANPGTDSVDNGIYVWNGTGNPMTRSTDFAATDVFYDQTYFSIGDAGTANFGSQWKIDASTFTGNTITVGTTSWGVEAYSAQAFQDPVVLGDKFYVGLTTSTFSGIELGISSRYEGDSTATLQWQYYNGAWTDFDIMSTLAEPSYRSNANQSFGDNETFVEYDIIRFNHRFKVFDDWTTTSINSVTAYYIRADITSVTGVTTPVIETVKIHRNYTKINPDGFVEFFGTARPLNVIDIQHEESFKVNSYTQPTTQTNVDIANNTYALDPDITFSRFNEATGITANSFITNLPDGIDTSFPMYARIFFYPLSTNTGNIYLVYYYTTAGTGVSITANTLTNTVVTTATAGNGTIGVYQSTDVFELPIPTWNSQVSGDPTSTTGNYQTLYLGVLRDAANAADTFTGDIVLFKVVIWYRIWSKGNYSYAIYN